MAGSLEWLTERRQRYFGAAGPAPPRGSPDRRSATDGADERHPSTDTRKPAGAGHRAVDRFRRTALPDPSAWRSRWPDPETVLETVGIGPGTTTVVVGAGAGFFPLSAACLVAPATVYAVDEDGTIADEFDAFALDRGIENLVAIAAAPEAFAASLPERVDAVLIADALVRVGGLTAVAEQAFRALRPGGRLLVIDQWSTGSGSEESADRFDWSTPSRDDVRRAVGTAGFALAAAVALAGDGEGLVFERAHDR